MRIALAGKGGVGKTTLAALFVSAFMDKGVKPVLVVDADSNSNLNVLLGINYEKTIADIREEVKNDPPPAGMSRPQYFALQVEEAITEGGPVDFIAMGHHEGRDCYCSINNILREFLGRMRKRYPVEIIDNEAGLEHISRQTDGKVDWLIFVANKDRVSLDTVKSSLSLLGKLKIQAANIGLVINRADKIPSYASDIGIEVLGVLPYDKAIENSAESGSPLGKTEPGTKEIIDGIMKKLENKS
ncbi:AAA family ATPase [bacterium]|nr:AAA family ATPase [bacterium]MBU4123462.1 AAA family ATPase [bacterium]